MNENDIRNLLPEFLLNSETYSLVITDLEGRYSYVNNVFKDRFAFMNIDFVGQPFSVAIHPEDVENCNIIAYQCIINPNKSFKILVRKPDNLAGDFYWTHWEFSLFKDQHQNPIGILCLGHDITETEKASKQAKELAQKVETIIEEITDGFYVLDREWKFVKINKVAEQIFGISRANLLGSSLWDLFPDTPEYNFPEAYRKSMKEYITVTFEDYRVDLDKWFGTVCYPSQEGLTIFFRDTTQEHKNRIALENTSKKLQAILESTLNSYILISPFYKILHFNQVAEKLVMKSAQKTLKINEDIRSYISIEDKEVFDDLFYKALKGEKNVIEIRRTIEDKETWFEIHYLPVYEEKSKELIGITLKNVHIDDRKQVELKLTQSEIMLRALYDSSSEAITFIDTDFRIAFNNKLAREITKNIFGKEAQVGEKSLDYYVSDLQEEFEDHYQKVLKGENIYIEKEHCGSWWAFSLYPVYDIEHNIVGIAENVQDITVRKQHELRIFKQNETLKQIAWQQSHEVRRPVANILGLYNLLKEDQEATTEEKQKYLDFLLQATKELDHIIHKIVAKINEDEHLNN